MLQNPREGKDNLINLEGREMIVAMALDRPLADAQSLVESPQAFVSEILQTVEAAKSHPVISEMLKPDVRDDLSYYEVASHSAAAPCDGPSRLTQNPIQPPATEQ